MIIRCFDIETVADPEAWSPTPDLDHPNKQPFSPPHAHEVAAIAWVDLDGTPRAEGEDRLDVVGYKSLVRTRTVDEEDMITTFGASCSEIISSGRSLMFVTWNGRRFDGPVLALRAMRHSIPWSWWWTAEPSYRYRYSESMGHVDLMDVLADFGAAPAAKLGDMARLLGMPGKPDMSGASVSEELAKGNHQKVADYCLLDAVQTAGIYVRHQYQKGVIQTGNMVSVFRQLEETIGNRYELLPFFRGEKQ
jgi:predicted PolB exonuclease-like 3'-5' exonuclease